MRPPLSALIISVTLLVLAFAGYAILHTKVASQSVAVADLTHEIEAKSAAADHLAMVRETLAALTNEEAAVADYFVPDTAVVAFIEELQSRAKALGASAEIASVATTPVSAESRPKLRVALSVAGPFDAVMRTLGSIEYAPYDLKVTGLSLTQKGDKAWVADLNLSVGSVSTITPTLRMSVPVSATTSPLTPSSASSSSATSTPLRVL